MKKTKTKKDIPPTGISIFLLVSGLFFGVLFTFVIPARNGSINKNDCKVIETKFSDYNNWYSKTTVEEIHIECADGQTYYIDGCCASAEVQKAIQSLKPNDTLRLLLHPESEIIVEFSVKNKVVLEFDYAVDMLKNEGDSFFILGLAAFACAGLGLYYIVVHRKNLSIVRENKTISNSQKPNKLH